MPGKVGVFATLRALEGKGRDVEAAAAGALAAVDGEHGTELYLIHRSADDPDVVRFYELYRDADALAAHQSGEPLKVLGGALRGLLAGPPEVIVSALVAGKGAES